MTACQPTHLQEAGPFPQRAAAADEDALAVQDVPALYLLQVVLPQRHPRANLDKEHGSKG